MSLVRRIGIAAAVLSNALTKRTSQPRVVVTVFIKDVPAYVFFDYPREVPFDG